MNVNIPLAKSLLKDALGRLPKVLPARDIIELALAVLGEKMPERVPQALTEEQVVDIKIYADRRPKAHPKTIAARFGVTVAQVEEVLNDGDLD